MATELHQGGTHVAFWSNVTNGGNTRVPQAKSVCPWPVEPASGFRAASGKGVPIWACASESDLLRKVCDDHPAEPFEGLNG